MPKVTASTFRHFLYIYILYQMYVTLEQCNISLLLNRAPQANVQSSSTTTVLVLPENDLI